MLRLLLAVLVTTLAAAPALRAQESAYRFEITAVGDSTVRVSVGQHGWMRAGVTGIAVDPMRRDALVARLRVLRVDQGSATALVTGQTTRLSTDHVALFERPKRSWFAQAPFWIGAALGAVVGAVVAH